MKNTNYTEILIKGDHKTGRQAPAPAARLGYTALCINISIRFSVTSRCKPQHAELVRDAFIN